jgi:hypothetical protein
LGRPALLAVSSRAKGMATGRSADLTNAEDVTRVGEVLRSEPDWHIAQDDTAVNSDAKWKW